jgi:hypothetical protein
MTVPVSMALLWIGIVGWTYVGLFEDDCPLYRSSWLGPEDQIPLPRPRRCSAAPSYEKVLVCLPEKDHRMR